MSGKIRPRVSLSQPSLLSRAKVCGDAYEVHSHHCSCFLNSIESGTGVISQAILALLLVHINQKSREIMKAALSDLHLNF